MARIRSIKPEFFESEDVAELPIRARLTWIGLWVHCDNYGRCKDNAQLVKKNIWPLDRITLKEIEEDLAVLAAKGRIVRYEAEGRPYLAVVNWDKHQQIPRPGLPKHPAPPSEIRNVSRHNSDASVTSHVRDTDASLGNREQGTGNRERQSSAGADGARFDDFWSIYPRKVGKKAAQRRWDAAVKDTDPDVIVTGAQRFAEHVKATRTEERFVAHPETWLNQGRWDDELATSNGQGEVSPLWRGADL